GFTAVGGLARGGLSRIWGALVSEFDAEDTKDWPLSIDELRSSYKVITRRIGVSGSDRDDMADFYCCTDHILPPLPLGASAARLLDSYRPGSQGPAFKLGLARNAILTENRGNRSACDLRKECLWGCSRGAIYDSRFDLAALERCAAFRLVDN